MRVLDKRLRGSSPGIYSLAAMIGMLAVSSPHDANAAAAPISGKAALDKKSQKLVISGKTTGIPFNSPLNVYDVESHRLIFSGVTDNSGKFKFVTDQDRVPCQLELQYKDQATLIKVGGADKLCKTKPACSIVGGNRSADVNGSVAFQANFKATKSMPLQIDWDFGDGTTSNETAANHAFNAHGAYLVTMTGRYTDKSGSEQLCSDAVTVSVAPAAGSNPNSPVDEVVSRPAKASGMPTANGGNDLDAIVVFPFEEMGMEGGSQINIPFNALYPYNAMNAQLIQKVPEKPVILGSGAVSAYYSAASNPNDPAGANSINSTSQNLFADGKAGANFDPATSSTAKTVYDDTHAYDKAVIAKTELWDKVHQPNATKIDPVNGVEKGLSQADTQNSWTGKPMVLPDQGIRGNADLAAGVRAMPGISQPYQANEAQKFDFNADQQAFVAQNIPLTPIDDQGKTNPFPLLRVDARVDGQTVAATDAVYTTASETGCVTCHYKGGKGADDQVWRTPVTINELVNPDGTPGPATGKGSFPLPSGFPATITLSDAQKADPVAAFKAPMVATPTPLPSATPLPVPSLGYGPAIHQTFIGDKFVLDGKPLVANNIVLEYDDNGVRKDRVSESRWLKPDGTTSPNNPQKDPSWKLQIRLKFKDASAYGEDTWQNREKAARWNTMLMHDYMTPINYNNARDDVFTEYVDDQFTTARNAVSMCASHHTSTLKYDTGAGGISTTTTLSQYTRTEHAFHGKMQVYKEDGATGPKNDQHPDGKYQKGELIRDERGHPIMWGGRGWDSVHMDEEGMYFSKDANGDYTVKKAIPTFAERNNWDPLQFPKDPRGQEMLPVGEDIPMEKNCLTCHTGKTEKSYRDIHHAAGLKCDSCHGDMMATGLVYPHESYNGNRTIGGAMGVDDPKTLTAVDFRRQWIDEPDCGSCHVGDANLDKDGEAGLNHYFSAGALKQAWKDGDKAAATIFPVNARFAVMPTVENLQEKSTNTTTKLNEYVPRPVSEVLYRKSADVHGSGSQKLYCSTCHGGSHGLWPNKDPNANDNVTSQQLQGYDGNIAECSTCHVKDDFKTGKVATEGPRSVAQGYREGKVVAPTTTGKAYLAGPHGMHPVGDKYWYEHADGAAASTAKGKHNPSHNGGWHNDMAKKPGPDGEDQCAACHGADHKGSRLSRSLTERTLSDAKSKPIKVVKDQIIGCDLCHSLQTSFTGVPQGADKLDPPPVPDEIVNGAPIAGGHH